MAKRTLRIALAAAIFALPASAGHSAERADMPITDGVSGAGFEAQFESFEALPPAPLPAAGAVDIAAIEPVIELPPAETGLGQGIASYYAGKFHGRRTASGETFNMHAMTAAHRTLPFGSMVRVTNPANGRSVVVRINDRGPFTRGRTIDVSRAAADQLGLVQRGHGTVELALLES